MPAPVLDIPVFDADNHLYETQDALTKFLPDRYRGAIDYVDVRGRTKVVVRGRISEYIPNPSFEIEIFRRSIHISPFWEEDLGALAGLIGDERVLFGSDYPHPEGLAEPATYVHQLAGVADESVRKIMGGNLARLMNVDDAAIVR
jgi:Amidohydrolase